MFTNRFIRWLVGGLLGCFAGISLTVSVLPVALQFAGFGDRMALTAFLSRLVPLGAFIWTIGGLLIVRVARMRTAAAVLGTLGLVSGPLLAAIGLAPAPRLLLVAAAAGWVYGFIGGLILGRILSRPAPGPTA